MDDMATNVKLDAAIKAARLSHDGLARRVRDWGSGHGLANGCNRSSVHRWLNGATPQPHMLLILEAVLGQPAADLGFASEAFEMSREQMLEESGLDLLLPEPDEASGVAYGELSGIWLSRYEYESSSRKKTYVSQHYCLLLQRGQHLTIRSLPEQASSLSLDLSVNGRMAKGTWTEVTEQNGYYSGAAYDGAIQEEVNQSGDRMAGMWVGFGRNPGEMNTGKWSFTRVSTDYSRASRQEWDKTPPDAS